MLQTLALVSALAVSASAPQTAAAVHDRAFWQSIVAHDYAPPNPDAVALDVDKPFLESSEVRALLNSALEYLRDERDVRGYDAQKGWAHSAAHTADLLKFLARDPHFTAADQQPVLDAIAHKLQESSLVFTHGEDERLARAVLAIVNRKDFDQAAFGTWVSGSIPKRTDASVRDPAFLRARQNVTNLFAKLEVLLSVEDDSTVTAPKRAARDALRVTLKRLF